MWTTFIHVTIICVIFQHSDNNEIKIQLNKNFSLICDWFVDNKLSIHSGEDKTKSILFSSKSKIKKASHLNIQYKGKKVKQYSKEIYLGCIFDITLSGESIATHVINKVDSRLRFLYQQNKFLDILYVNYYVMHWYNLFLIMRVTLGTLILTKTQKSVYKLLKINALDFSWN